MVWSPERHSTSATVTINTGKDFLRHIRIVSVNQRLNNLVGIIDCMYFIYEIKHDIDRCTAMFVPVLSH